MMKQDILIKANSKNGRVELSTARLGINGENLQGNIIIEFIDEFVNGSAVLELKRKNEKYYLVMNKENNKYTLPILSSLLTETCVINFQLRITVGTGENVPVWKSNIFYLKVEEAINSTTTIPEEYESWIDIANEKLNEIDNLDLDVNKEGITSTVTITKKDGSTKSVEINDGADGQDGRDGQDGQDGYTPQKGIDYFTEQDIEEMETDVKEDVLDEVYTKSETETLLQEKADIEDIPDVSSFITKDVNNLTNYTLKTNTGSLIDLEINDTTYVVTLKLKNQDGTVISTDTIDLPLESVVVSGRYDNTTKKVILTLENGSEVDFSIADLVAGLQTEITSQNKLASDLIDDTNSGNKFVTTTEKQAWNGKYTKPSGGIPKTDLTSEVQTSLGKADTALQSSDLTNYVTNTDYATAEKGGTIRTSNTSGLGISNGNLYAVTKSYNIYNSASDNMFIGKGTLENVITGRALENKYSMSEIKTGTWIDNKPVYRRFFTINLGVASNISQAHSLTDLDKFWINQSVSFVFRYNESLPSTWYYSDTDWARTWMTNASIRFRSPVDLTNRVLWVAVEYTKTTD